MTPHSRFAECYPGFAALFSPPRVPREPRESSRELTQEERTVAIGSAVSCRSRPFHKLTKTSFSQQLILTRFSLEPSAPTWKLTFVENPGSAPSGGALQEKVIWTAHPSQITNLPLYSACLIVIAAIIAAFSAIQNRPPYLMIALGSILGVALIVLISRWIITRSRTYQVTTERIKVIEGI